MYGCGKNGSCQLGIKLEDSDNNILPNLTEITGINVNDIQCISLGWTHTVIIMRNGDAYGTGSISILEGKEEDKVYIRFVKISIDDEGIFWAAAGSEYTLYLTKDKRVILCHKKAVGKKIEVQLPKQALSVFGGRYYGGIIDEDGCAYFLDKEDPYKAPERFEFPFPAVELVCCTDFKIVLLSNFQLYMKKDYNTDFSLVNLPGHSIRKISGYGDSCIAISNNGSLFAYGYNGYGGLGNGTTNYVDTFEEMKIPGDPIIRDVACSFHSLFLTSDGKLLGCGANDYNQLFHDSNKESVLNIVPIEINIKPNNVFVGEEHSLVISDVKLPENPAKVVFMNNISFTRFHISNRIDQQSKILKELDQDVNDIKNQIETMNDGIQIQIHTETEATSKKIENENQKMSTNLMSAIKTQVQQVSQRIYQRIHDENMELKRIIEQKDQKIETLENRIIDVKNQVHQENEALRQQIACYQQQVKSLLDSLSGFVGKLLNE